MCAAQEGVGFHSSCPCHPHSLSGINVSFYFPQSAHWPLALSINNSCLLWRTLSNDRLWLMTRLSSQKGWYSGNGLYREHGWTWDRWVLHIINLQESFKCIHISHVKLFKALTSILGTLSLFHRRKVRLVMRTYLTQGHTRAHVKARVGSQVSDFISNLQSAEVPVFLGSYLVHAMLMTELGSWFW